MEAPSPGLSPEDLKRTIVEHENEHYRREGSRWICKKCGSVVQQVTCSISIHDARWGDECAGYGEVNQIPLPYCPKCEGLPTKTSTCVHCQTRDKLVFVAGLLFVGIFLC